MQELYTANFCRLVFQLADTLEKLGNLPVTLLEAGVNFFGPLVHSSGSAAPGLKLSGMTVQARGLSVETSAHFVETLVERKHLP